MTSHTVPQPLKGLRVVEFTHMVMGPTCAMVLADMGAEVIKVEPIDGEGTRRLLATGGLADVELPDGEKAGQKVKTTLFPITMDGERLPVRLQPPRFGAHTGELLEGLGYRRDEIETLRAQAIVA